MKLSGKLSLISLLLFAACSSTEPLTQGPDEVLLRYIGIAEKPIGPDLLFLRLTKLMHDRTLTLRHGFYNLLPSPVKSFIHQGSFKHHAPPIQIFMLNVERLSLCSLFHRIASPNKFLFRLRTDPFASPCQEKDVIKD